MNKPGLQKTAIRIASVTIALYLTIGTMTACSGKKQIVKATIPTTRGSVIFLEGTVKVDGKPAEFGTELGAITRIETGPASSCEIVFDDKNIVKIMQNTFAELDFSKVRKEIKLERGGVAAVLKKLETLAGTDSFRINAPAAVAGVRGTTLCVWADATSSYICACNGKVHTIDANGSNEISLEASHHTARLYSVKDSAVSVELAGMLHHSDATVETLASKIGYTLDWTKID